MSFPTPAWDISLLHALDSARSLGGSYFFINLSELAGPVSSAGFAAIIGLLLLVRKKVAACAAFIGTFIGANAAWLLVKHCVERPRPPELYAGLIENGSSFPSGHATNAFALATFGAMVLYHQVPPGWARRFAIGLPLSAASLIAFGRVYLGVHYASDVIAGALLGIMFGYAGAIVWKRLKER